jgi:hypothetical protein
MSTAVRTSPLSDSRKSTCRMLHISGPILQSQAPLNFIAARRSSGALLLRLASVGVSAADLDPLP